jgi:MFS family permease
MVSLDLTVVNVALETLSRAVHASVGSTQWVVTSYALALAATAPAAGWVARRFGTRRVYVVAVSAFALASRAAASRGLSLP